MKTPEDKAAFLKSKGWEYGETRLYGWVWKHRVTGPGVCFGLEAAYQIEVREHISERG